ncbi:MAG: toxin TumE [Candidatus Scalindua sp.]
MCSMLFDSLIKYLSEVEATVRQAEGAYVERYEEEIVAADRVNLRIRVRFQKGHMLELNEAVISEAGRPRRLGYRYHFQDEQNKLVFRYDNTPHFPGLENFFLITSTFRTR